MGPVFFDCRQQFDPVQSGHHEVGEHSIDVVGSHDLDCAFGGIGERDDVAGLAQVDFKRDAHGALVVYNQNGA